MGPSGSGKTTLLDVLAGRKTVGTVSGSARIAGRPPTRDFLRRYAGYVEQFGAWSPASAAGYARVIFPRTVRVHGLACEDLAEGALLSMLDVM
jgi:ABC-type Mn2+/Zn2+ transport system ATPase subunit